MERTATKIGVTDMTKFPAALAQLLNEKIFTDAAIELGISKATLGYWLQQLDIEIFRVAVLTRIQRVVVVPIGKRVQLVDE